MLATGLDVPWGLARFPDGSLLVSTRDDVTLRRVDVESGAVRTLGRVPAESSDSGRGGEGGLLGIAVSPTYDEDGKVFAYYSTATDNRIAWSSNFRTWTVILDGIPRGIHHNGGGLMFGPDGWLYASTGEAGEPTLAQSPTSLGGKILRMGPGGEPAPGNPDPDSVILTTGHRNVQGMAFDTDGRLWASEFGDRTADELNWIRSGRNYGWPETEGMSEDPRFTNPVAHWGTDVDSPSGIAYASGAIWMAALRGERLWRIGLNGTLAATPKAFLTGRYGRLRSVLAIDDRTLVVGTSNRDGRGDPGSSDDRLLLVKLS